MAEERQVILDIQANNLSQLEAALKSARAELKGLTIGTEEYNRQEQGVAKLSNAYKEITDKTKQLTKEQGVQAGSLNDLRTKLNAARKEFDNLNVTTESGKKRAKELTKEIGELNKKVSEQEEATGRYQRNVGNYKSALAGLIPGFKGVEGAIGGVTKAALTFIATPIGAVIAAIGLAVAALTQYFRGSEEGQNNFNKVVKVAQVVLGNLLDIVNRVGAAIFKLITGDLKGAGEAITDAFNKAKNIISETREEIEKGLGIESLRAETDLLERNTRLQVAKNQAKIADLKLQSEDKSIDLRTRIGLLQQATALEKENARLQEQIAQNRLTIKRQENALSDSTKEDLTEETNLEIELFRIQKENGDKRKELFTKEQELRKQLTDQIKAQRDEELAFAQKQDELRAINDQIELDSIQTRVDNQVQANRIIRDESAKTAAEQIANQTLVIEKDEEEAESKINLANTIGQGFQLAQIFAAQDAEFQKGLAVTQAIVNGLLGATNVLTQKPPIPFPGNVIAATITAGTGFATAAKISAAAGGGEFRTKGPTLLLVGDNPGGVERVTVEPISGKGQTRVVSPNLVAMAGGGSITTGLESGIESASATTAMLRKALNRPVFTSLTELQRANTSFVESENTARLAPR